MARAGKKQAAVRPEKSVSVRLPFGVRDYLPAAAALRLRVTDVCLELFAKQGYQRIITPLFEYADVLGRGSAATSIRFVEPSTGEVVSLRPDITPQVARLVATRLADTPGPIRLCYAGSVVRMSAGARQRELAQVGVELIDAPQPQGDAEVMALGCASLEKLGIADFVLDVGHTGFLRTALSGTEPAYAVAMANKDIAGTERLAAKAPAAKRKLLAALPRLYGPPADVVSEAKKLCPSGPLAVAIDELAAALGHLRRGRRSVRVTCDLAEVRGVDYYTGLRFSAYAKGYGDALFHGGRYDDLCARYGRAALATGFALETDAVADVLGDGNVSGNEQGGK